MRLTPTEEERLRVFTAAQLARSTLAKGLRLNAPEAIALVCDEMHAAGCYDVVERAAATP
jgi:urease subunit gamma/beta